MKFKASAKRSRSEAKAREVVSNRTGAITIGRLGRGRACTVLRVVGGEGHALAGGHLANILSILR